MKPSRRKFLTVTGSAAIASVAGVGSASAASASDIPVPDNTSMLYPTMGTSADNPTATVYGNFKCPFTQAFVHNSLQGLIEDYVKPGKMNIRFRQVAYEPDPDNPTHGNEGVFISSSDPRIAAAALGVWDVSPEDYWSFFYTMFDELVSGTVTLDDLASRMKSADVSNVDEIRSRTDNGRYSDLVKQSTEKARDLGVEFTPTFEMGGEITAARSDDISSWVDSHMSSAVSHMPEKDSQEERSESPSKSKSKSKDKKKSKDKPKINQITFDGGSAKGWANYEFTVSGGFEMHRATKTNIGDEDTISGSTAKGGVGPWKDTFAYTGKITKFSLSQPIDVYRNGEKVDLEKLKEEIKANSESDSQTTFDVSSKSTDTSPRGCRI